MGCAPRPSHRVSVWVRVLEQNASAPFRFQQTAKDDGKAATEWRNGCSSVICKGALKVIANIVYSACWIKR